MLLNCGVGDDSWESLGLQGDQTTQSQRKLILTIHWNDWCWSWSSNTLATWCEELTHLKRPWCWERLKAGGEGDDRGWDGWMASLTRWIWVWAHPGRWRRTGQPGVLQSVGSQSRTQLSDWTELNSLCVSHSVMSDSLQPHGLQHARLSFEHHQLPELAQTHVHRVGDAIQPSHPLMSPSPPVFNVSQHQGIFQWVSFFTSGG